VNPDGGRVDDDGAATLRLLTALITTGKSLRFYPPTNPQVRVSLTRLEAELAIAAERGGVVLRVGRDGLVGLPEPAPMLARDLRRLAFKLHCLNVAEMQLGAVEGDALVALVNVLNQPYETLLALGPLAQTLAARGIEHVQTRDATTVRPGDGSDAPAEPTIATTHATSELLHLLEHPGRLIRELVRLCVQVVPEPDQRRVDAQIRFVDHFLAAVVAAVESSPAAGRPDLYERLAADLDAMARAADPSGAKLGGLPTVDWSHVDSRVREILPQRDLVKEISSKVKLHQGATTVMTAALRELDLSSVSADDDNPVLDLLEQHRGTARSVATNIQVLEEIRVGDEVDGEYPGIRYAERDRNKNFSLGVDVYPAQISAAERRATEEMVDLSDWRPELDAVETILDMLANERRPAFFEMIADRLRDKLSGFLANGDLDAALGILRGLNVERRRRRDDEQCLALLESTLADLEGRDELGRLLAFAETLKVESPAFRSVQSFLFLLDKRVIHTIIALVAGEQVRYSQRRIIALTQFLCRNRIDLLAEGLTSDNQKVVRTVTRLLGRFGPPALPHLIDASRHADARVRREAIRGLATVGGDDAVRAIGACLGDPDDDVVTATLRALHAHGSAEALPALEGALLSWDWLHRPEATSILLARAAGSLGAAPTLNALHKLEERGGLRLKLRAGSLRTALRNAATKIEQRLEAEHSS